MKMDYFKVNERDYSIDLLKFLAVFIIMNSHMDSLYPDALRILATGGAIGDTIFLFCSGYTLSNINNSTFGGWYKKRISRIYPSVIICSILGSILTQKYVIKLETIAGGEFIMAIMIYYIVYYLIKCFIPQKLYFCIIFILVLSIIVYIIYFPYKYETGSKGIYGFSTLFRWIPYFAFMLIGSAVKQKKYTIKLNLLKDSLFLFISVLCFYLPQYLAKNITFWAPFQIVTILPLIGINIFIYKLFRSLSLLKLLINNKTFILFISSLCLESYLIQYSVFTEIFNNLFPLNLIINVILVLIVSFVCKILSRLFIQIFNDGDLVWKNIIKLY